VLKGLLFALFFSSLLISSSTVAWAAQLEARINPDDDTADFEIKYLRNIRIGYPEGGELADDLRTKQWKISLSEDSSNPDVKEIIKKLNDKIQADGSVARVTELKVEYSVEFIGRGDHASIDYKIILEPTLSFFTIRQGTDTTPALIDAAWRGLTVTGPIIIDGVEINQPISAIKTKEPEAYSILQGTEAESFLSKNLIDAEGIKNQPLGNWHFLFDPTGISVDASTFGLSEEISGFVVSSFTMGESSFREGIQVEKVEEISIIADKEYLVRSTQSADSAGISLIGFGVIESSFGAESFGVSPTPPEGYTTTSTGGFPTMIIYGMAGMAAVGAIAILIISNRKLKKDEGMGQTGIDPSQLLGVATSAASGGYQTVRGEAQLASQADYAQTKSVYEEEKKSESTSETSKKGALPKGTK